MKELKKRAKELEALGLAEDDPKAGLVDKDGKKVTLDDIPDREKGSGSSEAAPEVVAAVAAGAVAAEAAREMSEDNSEEKPYDRMKEDNENIDKAWENEADRLRGVVPGQKDGNLEQGDEKLAQLWQAVEDSRNAFARKDYETTNTFAKLKRFFGRSLRTKTEDISDTQCGYEAYREAANNYLDYRIDKLKEQGLSQEDLKKEMGDLWTKLNFKEKLNLYEARTNARAQVREGKFGEKALAATSRAINWYRKLDWKYKLAFSGVLMAGGVGAVAMAGAGMAGTGMLAGIVGTGKFAQRTMGGASAGMGAVAMQEAVRRKLDQRASEKGGEKLLGDLEQEGDAEKMFEILKGRMQSEIDTYKASLEREKRKSFRRKLIGFGIGAAIGSGAFARVAHAGFGRVTDYFNPSGSVPSGGGSAGLDLEKGKMGGWDPNPKEDLSYGQQGGYDPEPDVKLGQRFEYPPKTGITNPEPVAKVSNLGQTYTENSLRMPKGGQGIGLETENSLKMPKGGQGIGLETENSLKMPKGQEGYSDNGMTQFEKDMRGAGGKLSGDDGMTQFERDMRGSDLTKAGKEYSPYETTGAEFERPGGSNYYRDPIKSIERVSPVGKVSNLGMENQGVGGGKETIGAGGSGVPRSPYETAGTEFERPIDPNNPYETAGAEFERPGANLGETYTENSLKMDTEKDYVPAINPVETAQRGDSVWKMIDRQLETRYGHNFTDLPVEQKTYIIDSFKDEVSKDPGNFGLENIDKVKVGQKINFTELFQNDQKVTGVFDSAENLSPEEMESIAKNNKAIVKWLNVHHGEALTSEKVEDILQGNKAENVVHNIKSPVFVKQFDGELAKLAEIGSEMNDPANQANLAALQEQYGDSFKKTFSEMRRKLFEGDSGIKNAEDLKSLDASEYLEGHKRSQAYKMYKYAVKKFGEDAIRPKAGEDMAAWSRKLIVKIFETKGVKL